MAQSTVSNASPLIALHQINQFGLLSKLFDEVLIPVAVSHEIATVELRPNWLQKHRLTQPVGPKILRASLGPGESEAISLALELNSDLILLDDRPARRLAQTLGLNVIGTLGILLAAKRREHITQIRPLLDILREHQFRIADNLYDLVLRDAGEW